MSLARAEEGFFSANMLVNELRVGAHVSQAQ
jgi:hypothetical protein